MAAEERDTHDMNRDPITDEPGAHPAGVGLGSAGGAATGAAVGAIAGPLGAMVGGVVGAVAGAYAGKAAAEAVNPTGEEAFWRDNYSKEPYYESGRSYDDYGPAYRLGVDTRVKSTAASDWASLEPDLATSWESARGSSSLDWERARPATLAAWTRADDIVSGRRQSGYGSHLGGSHPGVGGMVGAAQTAGNGSGSASDVVDLLQDLVECCKDGEYGFRECADQAKRADLKSVFLQRADDCRQAAQDLNQLIRDCGGKIEEGGSAMGAIHRGWVSIKSKLTTYDDKAVLEECERGEDNAKARYRKALDKNLPANVRSVVERQYQGVQRNHDQVKMLRDQARTGA